MSEALKSAQQSLQQAGQQSAQNGQNGQKGQNGEESQSGSGQQDASDQEWGKEFGQGEGQSGQSGQSGQPGAQQGGKGGKSGQASQGSQGKSGQGQGKGAGPGMGGPGIGMGGHAGAQQPLPGAKKDRLVPGSVNSKGQQLTRTYMGTPDPTQDRAAYYSIVPDKLKAAEASLNREEIPTAYKSQVRRYFDSIQPR
jgi:hypothetical protein